MAMSVMHNSGAAMALGELNKNINKVGKLLGKVSSGMKINSAQDDAAGFSITEKMREQIRSLLQDNQNVQNGSSLLRTAEGGIDEILNELRRLKELAINSANDHNSDKDRETIQKEFNQRMANINYIATETNYNGKPLLDGTWGKRPIWEIDYVDDSSVEPSEVVHSGAVEPTDPITNIPTGDYTISTDGVYILDPGYSGNITINATNVKIMQADSSALNGVYMVGPADGNANLWIEGLNIFNTRDNNFIKFQGENNTLNFKGENTFNTSVSSMENAVINVGEGATIEGGVDGEGIFNFLGSSDFPYWGAIIGSDEYDSTSSADIVVNSGHYHVHESAYREGCLIGSGRQASIGNITIYGGEFIDDYGGSQPCNALIGAADNSTVGKIEIHNATISSKYKTNDPTVGVGYAGKCDGIYISNSTLIHRGSKGSAVGTSGYGGGEEVTGDIVIENCVLDIQTETGAGIGSGEKGRVGDIYISGTSLSNVSSIQGEVVGKGFQGFCGKVTPDGARNGGTGTQIRSLVGYKFDPLVIHHGTKANQKIHFFIDDMHTKSLQGTIPNEADRERLNNLTGEAKTDYENLLNEAKNLTLDDVNVKTKHGANVAVRVIDGAIDYALDESTRMGSYIQRLEYTDSNITTMNENIQGAESTIRDADMAREMTEYTKYNILTQSSQAMLAQANQNSSQVLSLLQ